MVGKTKATWINGYVIKQGDTASIFKLKLKTDEKSTLNGPAKLQLFDSNKAKLEYDVEVVNNVVSFALNDVLPVGDYLVEVEHAGYVFPSTDPVVLTVNENLGGDFDTEKVATLKKVEIAQEVEKAFAGLRLSDEQVADVASRITDHDTVYDDTALSERVTALESAQDVSVVAGSEKLTVAYDGDSKRYSVDVAPAAVIAPLELVGGVYQFNKVFEDEDGNYLDKSQKRLYPFIIQENDWHTRYLAGGDREITAEMTLEEHTARYGKNKVFYNRLTGQFVLNLDFSFYRFPFFKKNSKTGIPQAVGDMAVLLRIPDNVPKPVAEGEVIVCEDDLVRLQLYVGTEGNVKLYVRKGIAVLNREVPEWTWEEVEIIKSRVIKRRILAQLICY
ncbi:TPA: hypothetical protein ACGO3D_000568 [Streptococcus suis]